MNNLSPGDTIIEIRKGKIITPFNLKTFGASGVWALYGIEFNEEKEECLNVGVSTKEMDKEILYDVACYLHIDFKRLDKGTEKYINQFNDPHEFLYIKEQQLPYLYAYIATKFPYIRFEYVSSKNTRAVEKEFAHNHHARYWRNGYPFGIKPVRRKESS